MTQKVLVLCQRKKGVFFAGRNGYQKVEEEIVPQINALADSLLPSHYTIEYLSSLDSNFKEGEVDIKGVLANNGSLSFQHKKYKNEYEESMPTGEFIAQNEGTYALIILNTCPFILMDYDIISQLLAPDGLMVFSVYPNQMLSKEKYDNNARKKLFVIDEDRLPGVLIYKKKPNTSPDQRSPKKASPKKTGGTKKARKKHFSKKSRKTFQHFSKKGRKTFQHFSKKCRKTFSALF
jgi:hypothetical protein